MSSAKARNLITADSSTSVDPELNQLMQEFPGYTQLFLHNLLSGKDVAERTKIRQSNFFPDKTGALPHSDYKSTYVPKNARPRSSKRPLRTPPVHVESVDAENLKTAYRAEYVPLDLNAKAASLKKNNSKSQFSLGNEAEKDMANVSAYKENFVELDLVQACRDSTLRPKTQMTVPLRKFESETTSKVHFARPSAIGTRFSFAELPSFAGSIIYPSNQMETLTTNMHDYHAHVGATRVESKKASPFATELKQVGPMDLTTVHRSTYTEMPLDQRPLKVLVPPTGAALRGSADSVFRTQSMDDFQHRPAKPGSPATPAQSYINLRFDNKTSFDTEQRSQYRPIDSSTHQPSKSVKRDLNKLHTDPEGKFDGTTWHNLTYKAHDLSSAHCAPAAPVPDSKGILVANPKFYSDTTSKEHFRDWSSFMPGGRARYGDFREAMNAFMKARGAEPPAKFETMTTSKQAFVQLPREHTQKVAPLAAAIQLEGDREFDTVYRTAYVSPKPRLSGDDMKILKNYLEQLKASSKSKTKTKSKSATTKKEHFTGAAN